MILKAFALTYFLHAHIIRTDRVYGDLLGDALVHLAGAMTAVGAGAYKPKR